MGNVIRSFILFILFFISFGIQSLNTNEISDYDFYSISNKSQISTNYDFNTHSVAASNSQNNQILSSSKRKTNFLTDAFDSTVLNSKYKLKIYFYSTKRYISFHNISYCLKNEICTRAP